MIKNTTLTNKLALIVIPVVLGLSLMLLVLFLSIIKSNHNENTARVLTAQVTSAVNNPFVTISNAAFSINSFINLDQSFT